VTHKYDRQTDWFIANFALRYVARLKMVVYIAKLFNVVLMLLIVQVRRTRA